MKIVKESLLEVLRSEDQWANDEIDKYQAVPAKEKYNPYMTKYNDEKEKIIGHLKYLEEYIWENGNKQEIYNWEDYINSAGPLKNLEVEQLENIFIKATTLVNKLKFKSY